jgi:hypothetical protein
VRVGEGGLDNTLGVANLLFALSSDEQVSLELTKLGISTEIIES